MGRVGQRDVLDPDSCDGGEAVGLRFFTPGRSFQFHFVVAEYTLEAMWIVSSFSDSNVRIASLNGFTNLYTLIILPGMTF